MIRNYELVLVLSHEMSSSDVHSAVNAYTKIIKDDNGTVVHEEDWGNRQLAFQVVTGKKGKRCSRAHYIMLRFSAQPDTLRKLREKFLISRENILRFELFLTKEISSSPSHMMHVASEQIAQ